MKYIHTEVNDKTQTPCDELVSLHKSDEVWLGMLQKVRQPRDESERSRIQLSDHAQCQYLSSESMNLN